MRNWQEGVSVIIPTYRRPAGIEVALQSAVSQSAGDRPIEIIVADNDPDGSAHDYIMDFAKTSAAEIVYKHVPEPGVSNARNGALSIARGRFIVFLDDDMEAQPGWLAGIVDASVKYQAAICFSPVIAAMPNPEDPLNDYMAPFFSSMTDAPEGIITRTFGTGGCLLDLSSIELPSPPFDTQFNETGGEDDALFSYLIARGAKTGWAKHAKTWEHVPAKRAVPQYIWKRNFAFGQGPTQIAADKGLKGIPGIVKWMVVGAVQFCLYGPQMLVLKWSGKPRYIHYYARTAQALGKIFWWNGFKQKLYGVSATTESQTA